MLLTAGLAAAAAVEVRLEVPFIRQDREGCGAAAAAMVMRYWSAHGAKVSEQASDPGVIRARLHTPSARGIYGTELGRYLEEQGFQVFLVNTTVADLERHLSRGRPLITAIRPRGSRDLHYVVVTGYDRGAGEVILHDSSRGARIREKTDKFDKMWQATGYWTLLAVPRTES
jgi:ABC-type bacteriocin/lantibiotic exporter with double-glycine peptidase domain